ncbi:uncharacterized protein JCM6883_003488 [Sporobolomyces salmoneus]|uniref:uncharacterized protein n=1 Tax=Sporobolomyces salmoneus TaxID=183962 RepID=UPI00316ED230
MRSLGRLMPMDSLPSFDLSRLLIGHTALSSLAALYSDSVPQWNIPLALYGLATAQQAQVTSEALSTFLLLFGGSVFLDLGKLLFGSSPLTFFFFVNFLLKPLTLLTALTQLRQTSETNFAGAGAGGMGDRILNATSGFPPFGHRQTGNETVWSAPPNAGGGPPGSYQTRFSLDDETNRDLESGSTTTDPLHAPPEARATTNQKSFVPPSKKKSGTTAAAEGGGYHTLE